MSIRKRRLTLGEIRQALGPVAPVILSPSQLAALIGVPRKTIYEWTAKGRLDGSFRRRGKHVRFWRDRVIEIIFNGSEWDNG